METRKAFTTALLLAVLLTGLIFWESGAAASISALAPPQPQGLFIDASSAGLPQPQGKHILRSRLVTIDYERLEDVRLLLNLFPDAAFTIIRDRVEQNASGSISWIGHVQDMEGTIIVLVRRDEMLTGLITTPVGSYRVTYLGDGVHAVQQMDPAYVLPPVAGVLRDYLVPEITARKNAGATAVSAADDGSVIDIMVVYTDDAADATILSEIEGAVAWTNQSYINSDINQRLWLVHTMEVLYDEEDPDLHGGNRLNWDLNNITDPNDGVIDDVHPTRNDYHADLTMFVVENADNDANVCRGLAWLQDPISPDFEDYGFATMESCLDWGQVIFAHEFGHNMGARHDWYVDDAATPFPYAHGYVPADYAFHTIMAYSSECSDQGASCPGIPNFSNPNIDYNGQPTGVDDTGPTNCTAGSVPAQRCQADNHRTLNNSAPTVAGFRQSEIVWTGAVNSDWHNASNWDMQEGPAGSTTLVHRVPREFDDVRIPATATAPVISADAVARNVLIEDGATLTQSAGVLTVYGDWGVQGAGAFHGNGGEVVLTGRLPQSLIATPGSYFPNLSIGDGVSTQEITLGSDLDVNGDLTLQTNATLTAGAHTLHVAGNWNDSGRFAYGTSTVILDGAAQDLSKPVSSAVLMDEQFSKADGKGCGCSTAWLPDGWKRETVDGSGWFGGELHGYDGSAILWWDSTDGWLFTTGFNLEPGVTYRFSFDYRARSGGPVDFKIYYGDAQASGSMTTLISTATSSTNAYATRTDTFTVPAAGTYVFGIRAQKAPGPYAIVDNVKLEALSDLAFYDLQVASTDRALLFDHDLTMVHDLTVDAGATLDLASYDATVDGALTNNGTLRQTKAAPASATTDILRIRNSAGTADAYLGVAITPASGMGDVTVEIQGNQTAGCNSEDTLIHRCFDIAPATSASATIRFWYLNSERNGYDPANMQVWHWNGSSWDVQDNGGEVRGTVGSYEYVEVDNVSSYSPFGLRGKPRPIASGIAIVSSSIQLSWTHSDSFITQYQVWRAADGPYAQPGDPASQLLDTVPAPANVGDTVTYTDNASSLGDAASNDYYFIVAEDGAGNQSAVDSHTGEFDFSLVPGQ